MIWLTYLIALLVILLAGHVAKHFSFRLYSYSNLRSKKPRDRDRLLWWSNWFQGLSTEMAGVIVTTTILVILVGITQQGIEKRVLENQFKQQLVLQMGSPINDLAREAARQLRLKGWLENGALMSAQLNEADLRQANLRHANLQQANLTNANLQRVWISNANLRWTDLGYAKMTGALLIETDLRGSYMYRTDLKEANLMGADLRGADLTEANLYEAILQGNLVDEFNVPVQWLQAKLDQTTTLPDGTSWTPSTDMAMFTNPRHPNFWRSNNPHSPAYYGSSTP